MTTPRTRRCISHCARCNYCFSSDSAFDMHITHEGDITVHLEPADLTWAKGKKVGLRKLQSMSGTCDHQRGCWNNGRRVKVIPATIWALAMTDEEREKMLEAFRSTDSSSGIRA